MTALRTLIVTGLSALFLLLAGPPMFMNPPTAYTGVHLHITGGLVQRNIIDVDGGSPAYRAGLRSGEVVSCLSQRDFTLLFPTGAQVPRVAYRAGTPITLCVLRNAVWQHVSFVAAVVPPGGYLYESIGIATLRLAVFAIFLISGIALVMGRPNATTWIFFAYCLASVPSVAATANWTNLPPAVYAIMNITLTTATEMAVVFLLLFAISVPDDRVSGGWRRVAYSIAWMIAFCAAAFALFSVVRTDLNFARIVSDRMDESLTALTVLVVIARLAAARADERARFGWAAFAIIWGVVANDARNVLPIGLGGIEAAVLTVVMPLALMYAILRRHVIDVRFVISRTVVYAVITTLVVGIIGVVDWLTSAYLNQARVAMAIDALVTIGLGFVLHRTYGWLEHAADFVLFRKKHEAEAYLERLAKTLLRASRDETIDRALVHDPYEKFELTMAALFRAQGTSFTISCVAGWKAVQAMAFDCEHDLVRFLATERSRLHIHDLRAHVAAQFIECGDAPAVAIPIFEGDDLRAFALYGIHRSGTKLDPDEVEALEDLCQTAAQAYVRIENLRYRALAHAPLAAQT